MHTRLTRTVLLLMLAALAGCSSASSAKTPGGSPTPGTSSVAFIPWSRKRSLK